MQKQRKKKKIKTPGKPHLFKILNIHNTKSHYFKKKELIGGIKTTTFARLF